MQQHPVNNGVTRKANALESEQRCRLPMEE